MHILFQIPFEDSYFAHISFYRKKITTYLHSEAITISKVFSYINESIRLWIHKDHMYTYIDGQTLDNGL